MEEKCQKAKCISLEYTRGSYSLFQGVKRYMESGPIQGGGVFINRGTGWGESIVASKLELSVQLSEEPRRNETIWIDKYFKGKVGILTKTVRGLIEETLPEEVEVSETCSKMGTTYYQVSEKCLNSWLCSFWEKAFGLKKDKARRLAGRISWRENHNDYFRKIASSDELAEKLMKMYESL